MGRVADGRYEELDGLRGLAAAAVVVAHLTGGANRIVPGIDLIPFHFDIGGRGVQLFFMISGFVILLTVRRSRTTLDFAIARVTRLYPTFWACLAITLAIGSFLPFVVRQPPLSQVLANVTMAPVVFGQRYVDGAYWTLVVEWAFYTLVAVASIAGLIRNEAALASVITFWALAATIIAFLIAPHMQNAVVDVVMSVFLVEHAPLFATGMLMLLSRERGRVDPRVWVTAAAAVATAGFLRGVGTAAEVAVVVAVFLVVTNVPRIGFLRSRPLRFLGAISYAWYLLHQNISYSILAHVENRWIATLVALLVTMSLAWLVHEAVELRVSRRVRVWLRSRAAAWVKTS